MRNLGQNEELVDLPDCDYSLRVAVAAERKLSAAKKVKANRGNSEVETPDVSARVRRGLLVF